MNFISSSGKKFHRTNIECRVPYVHVTLNILHITIYTVHVTIYTVYATLYIVQCKLNIVQCILYYGVWTVFSVLSAVYIVKFTSKAVLYCTVLYCTELYCTILYCTVSTECPLACALGCLLPAIGCQGTFCPSLMSRISRSWSSLAPYLSTAIAGYSWYPVYFGDFWYENY